MKLPTFSAFSKPQSVSGIFNGVGPEGLEDAKNLVCTDFCRTRRPRRAVYFHKTKPDQIIVCENRLFFRFGNTLKEIVKTSDGSFAEGEKEYQLNNYSADTDRKLIMWDEKLYVLPDNIQIGEDVWLSFAESYAVSVALPFINSRTLFYTSGYDGGERCNAAYTLSIGMKLRFSWISDKVFTIKTIETKSSITAEGDIIDEGLRIMLDDDVSRYKSPPSDAKIKYSNPRNRPILNDLWIGYNQNLEFSGKDIYFYSSDGNYNLDINNYFKVGQRVKIGGSSVSRNNVTAKITYINNNSISFDYDFRGIVEAEKTVITLTPLIPDFSHILLTEDRLFGVDNSTGKLYISALKNPFFFYDNPKDAQDAWEVKINGTATGITLWQDNIICFTESGGFRILGYTALNFGIRQLSLNGIKKDCGDSLVRVGDTLYYYSEKGVMKYSGGSDKKISNGLMALNGVKTSITDGAFVYMLGNDRIWVYDTDSEVWWSENGENISQIFNFDSNRYLCTDDVIYLAESDNDTTVNWEFALHFLPNNTSKTVQPVNYLLSCSKDTDCVLTLFSRAYGETEWKNCGVYTIKGEGITKIPLFKTHCSGFMIRAEGYGRFSPESWTAYYRNVD